MVPLAISLLPPERRKDIKRAATNRLILFYGKALLSLLVLLAVEMLALIVATRIEINAFEKRRVADAPAHEESAQLEARVRAASTQLAAVAALLNERALLTPLFATLIDAMPQGVMLRSVRFKKAERMLEVAGYAGTRDELLDFEQLLKRAPGVSAVDIPLPSLLKAREVDFTMTVRLK